MGFKRVKIIWACFRDARPDHQTQLQNITKDNTRTWSIVKSKGVAGKVRGEGRAMVKSIKMV